MIEPHGPTVSLVIVAVNITLAISLAAAGSRANRDGLFLWAIAMGLHTLAFALFAQRAEVNDFGLIIVAAAALSASWAMFAEGLFQFQQRRPPRSLIWLPVAFISTVLFIFWDNISLRIALSSLIFCAQTLLILVVLYQGRRSTIGRGQYFVAIGLAPAIPVFAVRAFLAMTGQADKVMVLASNQVQAVSFLVSIVSTMLVAIGMLIMSKERSESRNQLLAVQDQLTGLANRRSIDDTLSKEWARAGRHGKPLALVMLDLDFFKKYNDHYGHQAGDECLKSVANTLQHGAQRAGDLAARYGGEEFCVVLPSTEMKKAKEVAEDLCKAGQALNIYRDDLPTYNCLTISLGVSSVVPQKSGSVESLVSSADQALYHAKENGRNKLFFYEDLIAEGVLEETIQEGDIELF